ncbi:MAG: ATP-dependent helicase [Rhodospirillaceae bacterium]|nr:ATP-dependent helicase [Rhodospirillaceae bacterium]
MRLAKDYFTLKEGTFLDRWLPGRDREIGRQTTPDSWRDIVERLGNPIQQRIVADDREQTNVLVLAGPGSGKTRVLVHRIAYLVRVRRENARGILALAYNRHAAADIRRRLRALIGDDARGVTVLTCHGLAMRLAGASFTGRAETPDDSTFDEVMRRATALLQGEDLLPEEADEQRERLLAGFRWILVDEYQDIDGAQYDLISALAGRTREDEDGKLTLFAVGDDDQNIYAFRGASVEFIRRFEEDYGPKPRHLVDNYRSTGHIIAAANAVIEPARERMKAGHPIHIDKVRAKDPLGGAWQALDSVGRGRVQILPASRDPVAQAQDVMGEFLRLESLCSDLDWSRCAVIAREWKYLEPVRAYCKVHAVRAQMGDEEIPRFWRLRETRAFAAWLRAREPRVVDGAALRAWAKSRPRDPWHDLLRQAIDEHALETGGGEAPVDHVIEWLAEWGREIRRRQQGLLLVTSYGAKGLEFDHVAVLDGGWERRDPNEDPDAPRRLYYVAMTRAKQTLALARFGGPHRMQDALIDHPSAVHRAPAALPPASPELLYRHVRATLEDVDLGFAGRRGERDPIHRAIAALKPGDPLVTRPSHHGRWLLLDEKGRAVGRLAKGFKPPAGMRCRASTVFAVVGWSRKDTDPKFHDTIKCNAWEVVVPELVFEPR